MAQPTRARRKALTQRDWDQFGRAAERWADEQDGQPFRTEVERIIMSRLAMAWEQGYRRGLSDGMDDATEDEPRSRARNPYRA